MIDKTVNVNELKFHQCIDDVFYVVIYKDGLPLFEMDNQGIYNEINSLVITGYLKAFCSFTQYLTENNVRYINVGEVSIGFEEGENCAIYYIVKKVTDLIQFKMEVILNVFEMKYGDFLQDNSKYSIPANFDPFNIEVLEILSSEKVQFHYIPHKSLPLIGDSAYEIGDQTHLFSLIDGKRTIREIALLSNYELKEILVLFDTLQHVKVVEFHIKINNDDSFELTGEGIEFFFNNTEKIEEADHLLGEMSPHIIKSINGRRTVSEISQIYDEPISNLKQLLGILLQKGYISGVKPVISSIMVIEKIFEEIFDLLLKEKPLHKSLDIIDSVFFTEKTKLSNLVYFDGEKLSFDLIREFAIINELKSFDIYETFVHLIMVLFDLLQKEIGEEYVDNLREQVFNSVSRSMNRLKDN